MMTSPDTEQIVDRALKALPTPRAPASLLPAVMAAAYAAAQRPWYARPWFSWPVHWQVTSAAALVLLLVATGSALASMTWQGTAFIALAGGVLRPLGELVSELEAFATAVAIVGRAISQSSVGTALRLLAAVCGVMTAASVAVGTVIGRVAQGGVR